MTKNNASWDLDAIYRGFDDPAWKAAVRESRAAFDGLREDLSAGEETLPAEDLAALLARYDEAALRFSTPETFLTLWIMGSLKWRPAWETVSAFPRVMTTA